MYGRNPRGPTLEVFVDVIRNQPEIPIDSKIPSDSTEDSEIPLAIPVIPVILRDSNRFQVIPTDSKWFR